MASIIIDEIVPTTWRLRLRGADGQTREVEYGRHPAPPRRGRVAHRGATQGRSAAQGPAREAARRGREVAHRYQAG
jgi:hypothetical protein